MRFFSLLRLRPTGWRVPTFAVRPQVYGGGFNANRAFIQALYGGAADPASYTPRRIVTDFNNSQAMFTGTASFVADFLRNSAAQYPQFRQDPASWSLRDGRTIIHEGEASQSGHSIYCGTFEPNRRPGIAADPAAALHFIATFPAGGGFLVPRDLYLEAVAEGRARSRFPADVLANNAQPIRDYATKAYKDGRLLNGEILILGDNAVEIRDHVITEYEGIKMQFLRPVTMANHIFYYGQAIWVTAEHPDFPGRSFHMYIGHGTSDVSLGFYAGDRLNVNSGIVTFKDVFRAGVITWEAFSELLGTYQDAAYALSLDGDVALAVDRLLQDRDPGLLWDRKVLTLLDTSWPADAFRFFNPYTPPGCSGGTKSFLAAGPTAAGPAAGDGECDVFDVDLDDFIDKTEGKEMATEEEFMTILEAYPTTTLGEQLVHPDGSPYPVNSFTTMLSMEHTPEYDVFVQGQGDLLGTPIDDAIMDELRPSLDQWLDWADIRASMDTAIADQVNALVDATDPFADGSTAGAVAARFMTAEFREGISQRLASSLSEALGPHSASFASLLGGVSQFESASPEVRAMLDKYPLVDALVSRVFGDMSAVSESGTSYLDAQTLLSVIEAKKAYFEDPQRKSDAQRKIAAAVTDLGDVSELQPDLARTAGEIDTSRQDLTSVNQKLLQTPDDTDLQGKREKLQEQIDQQLNDLYELEQKQAEQDELQRAGAETDGQTLDSEGADARHDRNSSADHAFKPGE